MIRDFFKFNFHYLPKLYVGFKDNLRHMSCVWRGLGVNSSALIPIELPILPTLNTLI